MQGLSGARNIPGRAPITLEAGSSGHLPVSSRKEGHWGLESTLSQGAGIVGEG